MISKELLSEVMRFDIINISIKDNILEFDCDFDDIVIIKNINIYELAHKCKEWAYENFEKLSNVSEYGSWHRLISYREHDIYFVDFIYSDEQVYHSFNGKNEPEAIFKACQWILDNK